MKLPVTAHEYQINDGEWIGCSTSNTTDNGDGTYTITDGLNTAIAIGDLKIRVKMLGTNPASTALLNTVSFSSISGSKSIQIFFIGDSLTAGVGTTGTGNSASGEYGGVNSYPIKTVGNLTGLDVTPMLRAFPGQTAGFYSIFDLDRTISLFDKDNFTDIYCVVFWGANDLMATDAATYESDLSVVTTALQAGGAKVIVVPALSRKDSYAASVSFVNITRRNTFNSSLLANYSDYADAVVDLSGYPEIFADDAPDNATYFGAPDSDGLSKVHLTDAGAELLATAVAASITALSITASIPITPVNYAANFIAAASITDSGQITAINNLVDELLANNLWHRFAAIYPFVGGDATAHKFNLKDPRDLDAAYRLVFSGSPGHDANGVTWASSSYADTNYSYGYQSGLIIFQQASLHYYSRTASPSTPGVDMGYYPNSIWLAIKFSGNSYSSVNDSDGSGVAESYTDTGLFTTSRNSHTGRSLYRNGTKIRDTTSTVNGSNGRNIYIGGINNMAGGTPSLQYPSNRNCGYAAIGYGLTDDEEAAHYTIIQAFQTALGRAV